MNRSISFSAMLLALWTGVLMSPAQGALLSGSFATTSDPSTVDLTIPGTEDWAKYSTAPGNSTFTQKSGGSNEISTATGVTGDYGGNAAQNPTFSWSGGTPVASGSSLSGVTNGAGGGGLSLSVVGSGQAQEVKFYLGNYQTNTTLTVSLPGATSYVDTTYDSSNPSVVPTRVYTIQFQADNPGDLLGISFARDSNVNGSSTLVLYGASLSLVPEPGSFALLAFAMLGLVGGYRRRRRT